MECLCEIAPPNQYVVVITGSQAPKWSQDGRNFAFVTYTCAADDFGMELPACEAMVRSIRFESEAPQM